MTRTSVKKEFEVPDGVVETIIEMAGYIIGYWAEYAVHDQDAKTYRVKESDEYGGYERVNKYGDLAWALTAVAFDHTVRVADYIREYAVEVFDELENGDEFPGGSIDLELADVVVQYAMFGEVVYG